MMKPGRMIAIFMGATAAAWLANRHPAIGLTQGESDAMSLSKQAINTAIFAVPAIAIAEILETEMRRKV